jgi:multiple sugar transport system permease protein
MNRKAPLLFLLPYLILFLLFFIFPFIYSLFLSFFVKFAGEISFVGLQNYFQAFTDSNFWLGVARVFYYGIVQVTIMLFLALVLALLLDSTYVKSNTLFRLIYFLPYAVPGVIAAIMWGFLYSPTLNPLLNIFHGLTGGKPLDLLNIKHVLYGIMNIATWEWAGYNMTIYFANLTSIPLDLYDAAKIDGCSEWQTAIHIKVPLIRSTLILTIVLSIIGSLQLFNEPFILNSLTSIPPAFTPNMDIYNMAFSYGNLTYSATLSIILTFITFATSMLFIYLTNEDKKKRRRKYFGNFAAGKVGAVPPAIREERSEAE